MKEKPRQLAGDEGVDELDACNDPLSLAEEALVDQIWESPDIQGAITDSLLPGSSFKEEVAFLLQRVINQYSVLATRSQIAMLEDTWFEAGTKIEGNASRSRRCLEEPLSWRALDNQAGMEIYALDLMAWRWCVESKAGRSHGGRGFGSSSGLSGDANDSESYTDDKLRPLSQKDDGYVLAILAVIAQKLASCAAEESSEGMKSTMRPRILLSEAHLRHQDRRFIFQTCEVRTYSGKKPAWDQLVSRSNSVVVLLAEPRIPADEVCWQSPLLEDIPKQTGDTAPVIILSVLQHGVSCNVAGLLNKMQRTFMDQPVSTFLDSTEKKILEADTRDDLMAGIFGPLASMIGLETVPEHERAARCDFLRSKIAPQICKAYRNRWSRIREERLSQLNTARDELRSSLARQKEQEEQAQLARVGITEAMAMLDMKLFEQRLAAAKGCLPDSERSLLQEEMKSRVAEAEAPVQHLVNMSCSAAVEAVEQREVLQQLQTTLENSKLSSLNTWLKAGQELRTALEMLNDVQSTASSLADAWAETSTSSSSSAVPTDKDSSCYGLSSLGAVPSLSDGIQKLSQELTRGEAAVGRFERSARAAGRTVGAAGALYLRQILADGKSVLTDAQRDEELREAIVEAFASYQRNAADVRSANLERLEARAAIASESGRSRLGGAIEEVLSVGRIARALQEAIRGDDLVLLRDQLEKARGASLGGLESAELRLAELQERLSKVHSEMRAAVEALDLSRFDRLCLERGAGSGVALSQERQSLVEAIAKEEATLQGLMVTTVSADEDLREALEALAAALAEALAICRLPRENAWRRAAQDAHDCFEAASDIRVALASASWDTDALEACLSLGSSTASRLEVSLSQVDLASIAHDDGRTGMLTCGRAATSFLQEALDEGYIGLAGARADEALASRLTSAPWAGCEELPWETIQLSDLRELEARASEATEAGRSRWQKELDAALEVGRCVVGLQAAMSRYDSTVLKQKIEEAQQLGLSGLKSAEQRLRRLLERSEGPHRGTASRPPPRQQPPIPEALERAKQLPQAEAASSGSEEMIPGSDAVRRSTSDQERCTNLIFVDLELTAGFYHFDQKPRILEAAVIITDKNLCELDRGHWVLGGFTQKELESLDDFHQANFRDPEPGGNFPPILDYGGGNGLFADVLSSTLTVEEVEKDILKLLERHCPEGECPLAGYSVQCDREVIKEEMPRLYRHVSHQMVDVSGFFTVARLWSPERLQPYDRRSSSYNHRAVNDVEDAIEALSWVRQSFFQE